MAKNTIKIISDEKIKNKGSLEYDLESYVKQKPNTKFLGLFRSRLWFYYKNTDSSDTTKWNNWVRRVVAEPPVIHKDKVTQETAKAMRSFMQHKGYFNARVEHETIKKKHTTHNIYKIHPSSAYHFDSISLVADDSAIQQILDETKEESFLKKGKPVDVGLYDKEVSRIVDDFRNRGYFDFTRNFISPLQADSSDLEVDVTLRILSPRDSSAHQTYRIGDIYIYSDYNPDLINDYEVDVEIDGVKYMVLGENRPVKYMTLRRNILLRPNEIYKRKNEQETKNRLASLGVYKFVSIKASKRKDEKGIVDFRIFLPSRKRMDIGGDLELNTANNTIQENVSIGVSTSINYHNKNLLGGAESFSTNLEGGVEFAIGSGNGLFNSRNVGLSSELNFPKFMDYSGIFSLMHTLRILPDRSYDRLLETATTKMSLGFDYTSFTDFYDTYSAEAAFGYNIIPNDRWRIQFTQTGLSYFDQDAKPAFDTILVSNPFFRNSFGPRLFTGFLMRDIQATFTDKNQKYGEHWSLRMFGEISGMEELLFNAAISPNKEWRFRDTLEFAHFIKFELESQYTKSFNPKQSLAVRGIFGIASPYGRFAQTTPYVKQFFVGGPNSVRAWSIRQLGPGSHNDPQSSDPDNRLPFYQTGDIKMEATLEYRFDMFWYFEGAAFLDVGNVWLLKEDSRVGSGISKDFWREFAVGTGFGLRLDFSYFIFRLDLGYPLRNNYPSASGRYWRTYNNYDWQRFRRDLNFNLAIGYPF